VTAPEQSHRFVVRGVHPNHSGESVTLIAFRETTIVRGAVTTSVVLSVDSTWRAAVAMNPQAAVELAEAIRRAAGQNNPGAP